MDKLKEYRNKIDSIDLKIMDLINQRFGIVEEIKEYKKINNLPILHQSREDEILEKTNNFDYSRSIKEIYKTMLNVSKDLQKD